MQRFLTALLLLGPALASPIPEADSSRSEETPRDLTCSQQSAQFTGWTLNNFYYHASYIFTTPAHQNSWGYVSFDLTSSLGIDFKCDSASSQLSDFYYGTQKYTCVGPNGTDSTAQFTFNRANGVVEVKQTWICRDVDPRWPATYTGVGNGTAAQRCTDSGTVVNEEWQMGQIYSTRTIECEKETVPVKLQSISAVA